MNLVYTKQSHENTTYDELQWSVHYQQVSDRIPNLDEISSSNYQLLFSVSKELSPMQCKQAS
jgi:hypothetical protein